MTSADIELLSPQRSSHNEHPVVHSSDKFNSESNQHQSDANHDDIDCSAVAPKTKLIGLPKISSSVKVICGSTIFTAIVMLIGILTVYYTSPKPPGQICTFILKAEARSLINADSQPHSIAAADFNNDGLPDIVVANSGTNNIGIFLRRDNYSFLDQVTYSTGTGSIPYAVAVGDFNKDQQLDIVVANFGSHSIGIFLGTGNGTFISQKTFSTGSSRPQWVAVADFNNDTQLDLAIANYGTNNIGIFLGDGKSRFTYQMTLVTGFDSLPYSIAVGDINMDNILDIVVANSGTNNVGVFFGFGDGTFSLQRTISTDVGSRPYSIAMADLNNDTYMDIAVACSSSNSIVVLLNGRNGTFITAMNYSTGENSSPLSIVIDDFDNDGKLDIMVANYGSSSLGLLLGYGNGSFANLMIFFTSTGSSPYSLATGDFNNDHRLDVVVVNYDHNYVDVILTYRNYSFLSQTTYSTGYNSQPRSVTVADLNGDRRLDIVVTNTGTNNVGVLLGHNDGTFSSQMIYSTGTNSLPYSAAVSDLNNDKILDIVIANSGSNTVGMLLGYPNGTFENQRTYSTGNSSSPSAVAIGDLDNDTRLDIVVVNYATNNMMIFFGQSNGTFAGQAIYSTGEESWPCAVIINDFNNDHRLDIAVVNYLAATVGIFLNIGNGTFTNQTSYYFPSGSDTNNLAVGDLNNDGYQDIVVTVYAALNIGILLGKGDGTFINGNTYSTGSNSYPQSIVLCDWNNDNRLDVVVTNCKSDNIVTFVGNDDGTLGNTRFYSTGNNSCPSSVTFGDLNDDGLLDVVIADRDSDMISILLGSTYMNGIRENTYSTGSAPHPRALALGDFNNDTQLDVTIVNYGLSNVEVLLQDTNGSFPSQRMFSTGALSFPTSVVVSDLNNDTHLDMIVTNSATDNIGVLLGYVNGSFGSPKIYSTRSESTPQSVVVGDLNNDRKVDIVVANSGTDSVSSLLKYDTGAFGRQNLYATGAQSSPQWVSLGDFNNDNQLDFVVANSGTNNIVVFLGLGDGTFSNQTTYLTGDNSYPWSTVVADLNNDSCVDIIVGNYWSANIGIFLGFCNGTFSNQTTYSTGNGSNPPCIAVADLNKDEQLDIVAALFVTNQLCILYGSGNGTFSNAVYYSTGNGSGSIAVAVADLNQDGYMDMVVTNYWVGNIGIFYGYTNGSFATMITYSTGSNSLPTAVVITDLNNDDRLDIAVANFGADNIGVFYGNIESTFSDQITLSTGTGSGPNALTVADINNDNLLDIILVNLNSNTLGVLLGCTNSTFFNQLTYSTGDLSQPAYLDVGDFNKDNRLDVVIVNYQSNNALVFFGYVSEDFLLAPAYSTGSSSRPTSIALADFNNDTRLDVVVANSGMNNVMILFGSGYGTFVNHITYSTGNGSQPSCVAVGDFNQDSRPDVIVANSGTNNVGVFLSNSDGSFSSQLIYDTGIRSQPSSVVVLDFNNDTRLDIAVANNGANNVGVFFGYGNGSFSSQLIFATGFDSHPFGLAVGDVNKDNLPDIVATNNGYGNIDIITKTC